MKIIMVAQEPAHCDFMRRLIPHFKKLDIKVAEFFLMVIGPFRQIFCIIFMLKCLRLRRGKWHFFLV